jgi:lysozyme family protein
MIVPGDFNACRAWLVPEEGGLSDDPEDPGGRTFEGITQAEYDAWCRLHNQPPGDVAKATEATVTAIYQQQYWMPYCALLPPGVALVFFDTSVVQGQHIAVVFLQRSLGIEADGHFGLITAASVKDINNGGVRSRDVIIEMTSLRLSRFKGTKNFKRFGKGWLARADACQTLALKMAGVL